MAHDQPPYDLQAAYDAVAGEVDDLRDAFAIYSHNRELRDRYAQALALRNRLADRLVGRPTWDRTPGPAY